MNQSFLDFYGGNFVDIDAVWVVHGRCMRETLLGCPIQLMCEESTALEVNYNVVIMS